MVGGENAGFPDLSFLAFSVSAEDVDLLVILVKFLGEGYSGGA